MFTFSRRTPRRRAPPPESDACSALVNNTAGLDNATRDPISDDAPTLNVAQLGDLIISQIRSGIRRECEREVRKLQTEQKPTFRFKSNEHQYTLNVQQLGYWGELQDL